MAARGPCRAVPLMPRRTKQMIEAGLCGNGLHAWVEGQGQCKDCKRERQRRWQKANPENNRECQRRWQKANPEKHRENNRRWREANPEKKRERDRRRRARRKNNGVYVVSDKDMRRLHSQPCAHSHLSPCNGPMHVDHVIPLSRGGTHGIGNLQMLCRSHNQSKSDRLEVEVRCRGARLLQVAS